MSIIKKNSKILIIAFFSIIFLLTPMINLNRDKKIFENRNLKTSSDTGWVSPSTIANVDRDSKPLWYFLDRAKAQDDSTCYSAASGSYNDWLRATNFGFSIPENNQIDGIEVRYDKYADNNDSVQDSSIRLIVTAGIKGNDEASSDYWTDTDTDTYTVYGGSSDKWGETWTRAEINSADFGVQISALVPGSVIWFDIDHVQIKIYYSASVSDESAPTWDTLTESADPLELGNTETININVYDDSTISNVYLEISGTNWTMTYISGDTWRNSTWTPLTIGVKIYQIHMIDQYGNINQTTDLNITVVDTTNPVVDNLVESIDPLELGDTETIEVDITDESSMTWVYLEFEDSNHSMSFVSGIKWEYTSWAPTSVGNYPYTVWANDTEGNIGFVSGNITVVDTTNPVVDNIIESADPLELTDTETIEVDITDESSMTWVYLEFEGSNHSMSFVSGIKWEYISWTPLSEGNYPYTVWANDSEGNIGFASGDITVQIGGIDNNPPTWDTLIFSQVPLERGFNLTIWINVYDDTNVSSVYIEIGNNNYTFVKYYNNTWISNNFRSEILGNIQYTIYMVDYYNNINTTQSDIIVISSFDIVFTIVMYFGLILSMLIFYLKIKIYLVILSIFLFSMIFGIMGLNIIGLPFTPYLQVFFMMFQVIIFLFTTLEKR